MFKVYLKNSDQGNSGKPTKKKKLIKNRVVDARNVDQVYEIHTCMADRPFGIRAERRLYLQDNFFQINKTSVEDRAYFLFSDMLVFAKRKSSSSLLYKGHIILERAKVRLLSKEEATGESHCIEIISSFQGVDSLNTTFMASPTAHIMKTSSENEQLKWKYYLESIVAKIDQMAMQQKGMHCNLYCNQSTDIFCV